MNIDNIFVPEVASTSEPIKATVKTTTLTENIIEMPDGEIINERLETTTVENMILIPKSNKTQDGRLDLSSIFDLECGKNTDIILLCLLGACILLATVLTVVVYKWRKEKVHVVNGFDMLSRGSSASVFNSSKME